MTRVKFRVASKRQNWSDLSLCYRWNAPCFRPVDSSVFITRPHQLLVNSDSTGDVTNNLCLSVCMSVRWVVYCQRSDTFYPIYRAYFFGLFLSQTFSDWSLPIWRDEQFNNFSQADFFVFFQTFSNSYLLGGTTNIQVFSWIITLALAFLSLLNFFLTLLDYRIESTCKDAPCIAPSRVTNDFCCFTGLISSHRPYTTF